MFEIKCSDCGKPATVSFKPTVGKPVYCRECFAKHTFKTPVTVGGNEGFNPKQAWARRRDSGAEKKENAPAGAFQWSFSRQSKEAI